MPWPTFYSPQATTSFIPASNQRLTSNAMDGNSRDWGAWRLRHDMQEIAEARKHTMEKDNKTKVIAAIAAVMLVAGGVTGGVA